MWQSGRKDSCSSRSEGGQLPLEDDHLRQAIVLADHRSLGWAGGAGGVYQHGDVVRLALRDQKLPQLRLLEAQRLAKRAEPIEADHLGVAEVTQAFQVVDNHLLDGRHLRP